MSSLLIATPLDLPPSSLPPLTTDDSPSPTPTPILSSSSTSKKQITSGVLRKKLSKMRHLVLPSLISPSYLTSIFPQIQTLFDPQTVQYNGGVAQVKSWKISCYLEVMEGGVPCTNPCLPLLSLCTPLLTSLDDLFLIWYTQQHACNKPETTTLRKETYVIKRLMTFITRYTPNPGEDALLKHVDGAGKVNGSIVLSLPTEVGKEWEGHGGGLNFWDGPFNVTTTNSDTGAKVKEQSEIKYESGVGDVAFIDQAVWHQANPITKGERWALVIFYDVK